MGILHMKDAGDNWACQCLTCLYRMEVCTCTESKRKSDNESYFYSLTSHRLFFFSLSFFFSISLSFAGNLDRHTGRKAEQWHPFLSACVAFPCVQTMAWLPVCLGFLTFYLWCSDRLKLPGWLAAHSLPFTKRRQTSYQDEVRLGIAGDSLFHSHLQILFYLLFRCWDAFL